MKLTFEFEFSSDYHIAAGHGLGTTVDSALLRESDGIPIIRGTTIAGLLRDGMRDLLDSLDWDGRCPDALSRKIASAIPAADADSTAPERRFCPSDFCPVCRIFGSPAAKKEWRISSARPIEEEKQRRTSVRAGVASEVVNRSAIDLRRRRSAPNQLFNREVGSKTLRFRFVVTGPDGERGKRDAALIVATARMVRQLGQARRRGSGACVIRLVDDGSATDPSEQTEPNELLRNHLDDFKTYWILDRSNGQVATPSHAYAAPSDWSPSGQNLASEPRRFHVMLVTREPVLVGAARQAGNEIASDDSIPGSALLGAFASAAARRWDLANVQSETYAAFANVFRRGDVTFPTLCPIISRGRRAHMTVPAPRDLVECRSRPMFQSNGGKTTDGHFLSLACADFIVECPECATAGDRNPLDRIEGLIDLANFRSVETRMREEMHVHIDPATKTAAEGDLFSYRAIDAGQHLYGEMLFKNDLALEQFQQLLGKTFAANDVDELTLTTSLTLGRAAGRGYGLVDVELKELPWQKKGKAVQSRQIGLAVAERISAADHANTPGPISLMLLTDAILVDSWGRYLQSVTHDWLMSECFSGLSISIKVKNQFTDFRHVGGFYAHIGLPRQRELAIAAGSVVGLELELTGDNNKQLFDELLDRIETLEKTGIGLRRNEGYGRVVFNHPVIDAQSQSFADFDMPDQLSLSSESQDEGTIQSVMQFIREWERLLATEVSTESFRESTWAGMGQWLMAMDANDLDSHVRQIGELSQRSSDKKRKTLAGENSPGDAPWLFEFKKQPWRATNFFADKDKGLRSLGILLQLLKTLAQRSPCNVGDPDELKLSQIEKRAAGLRMLGGALIAASKSSGKRGE